MWFCRVMLDYAFLLDPKKDACKCALEFTDNFFPKHCYKYIFYKIQRKAETVFFPSTK
mgnify:CR=1 FL=1